MAFKDTNVKPVIEPIVDNLESVNEKYRDLYAETTDGKFQIMADIAFQSDFENVRKALNAERELNKGNQSKIKELQAVIDSYDGIDPTAAKSKLIAELERSLEQHIKGELAKLRKLFFGATLDKIKNLEAEVSKLSKTLAKCRFNH